MLLDLSPKVAFMKFAQPKIVVHFAEHPASAVENALAADGVYRVSSVACAPGRLGWPLHGDLVLTFARLAGITTDPAATLLALSPAKSCVSARTLLNAVPKDVVGGWEALRHVNEKYDKRIKTEGKTKTVDQLLKEAVAAGLVPETISPVNLASMLNWSDMQKVADAERLVYWMRERGTDFGVVSSAKNSPVHVDGTVGKIKQMICARGASSDLVVREVSPPEVMALKGYDPLVHNLAFAPPSVADGLTDKAVPLPVVLAAVLAAGATYLKP